jgi:hypothetical protein
MNVSNSAMARGRRLARVSKTPANHAGAFVLRRELAPAFRRLQTGVRELELVRDARRSLRQCGVVREQGGFEELTGGRGELLPLDRDLTEQ